MFFWIAIDGRLWTAHRWHGLQDSDVCVLCDQCPEISDHLLVACVFSREVWHRLLQRVDALTLLPTAECTLSAWWLDTREHIPSELHKGFDALVLQCPGMCGRSRTKELFSDTLRARWKSSS